MNKLFTYVLASMLVFFSTSEVAAQGGCFATFTLDTDFIDIPTEPGVCGAVVTWTEPTVETTDCTGEITVSSTAMSGDFLESGVNSITYSATDEDGNLVGSINLIIEVYDDETPVPNYDFLADIYLECGTEEFDIDNIPAPTASDNCQAEIVAYAEFEFFDEENGYFIDWFMEDSSGNIHSDTQFVGFEDTLAPTPDMDPLPDVISTTNVTELVPPTATDLCSSTVTVFSDAVFPITNGTTIVTWTYTDESGNSTSQAQNVIVDTVNSIASAEQESEFRIYPNPSNGAFTVELSTSINTTATLRVIDSVGKEVYFVSQPVNQNRINLIGLSSGMYFVELSENELVRRERVIIK